MLIESRVPSHEIPSRKRPRFIRAQGRTLAIVALLLGAMSPAAADTLRCGSVLIQDGTEAAVVLAKCGEPASKQIIREPVYVQGAATGEVTERQIWSYYRGPGQFPAILQIADGVVQSIEFEKHHGQPSAKPSD